MNICFLGYPEVKNGNFGNGVAKATYQFANAFKERGCNVYHYHFFTRQQYKDVYKFCLQNHIDVVLWHMSTLNLKGFVKLPCPFVCLWHSSPNFNISNSKAQKLQISKSSSINKLSLAVIRFIHFIRNTLVFTYLTYSSDRFVLLSNGFIKRFFPAKMFPQKVIAIPNSISFNKCTNSKYLTNKQKQVIFIGRLREEKRLDLLLQIWEKIEHCNRDWKLKICGDGPDANLYKTIAKKLALNNVEWEGWCNDPSEYYKSASIICLTSEYEGFPSVLLEAQSYGVVPIVFNTFESASDIIKDGYNGKIIDPKKLELYASELLELMNNKSQLQKYSENAFDYVSQFNEGEIMDRWYNLLVGIANKQK